MEQVPHARISFPVLLFDHSLDSFAVLPCVDTQQQYCLPTWVLRCNMLKEDHQHFAEAQQLAPHRRVLLSCRSDEFTEPFSSMQQIVMIVTSH